MLLQETPVTVIWAMIGVIRKSCPPSVLVSSAVNLISSSAFSMEEDVVKSEKISSKSLAVYNYI